MPRPFFMALIHPSAWKGNSANSVLRGFSEVREPKPLVLLEAHH
jgi:hypothetical protein